MFLVEKIKNFFSPFYKSEKTKKILQVLNSDGNNQAMFVGGCVRNFLRKETITDIDIATILTPDEIINKFRNSDIKVKKTGIEHGTLTLVYDNQKYEITTLREDISTDGRHAKIKYTKDWNKDSKRRDFTINAIYLDQKGKLYDPQNGLKDLESHKVQFIGDPNDRIKEDYLRILRFLRFSIKYKSFDIDEKAQKAIKLNLIGITKLSKERVFSELKKIVETKNFCDLLKSEFLQSIFKLIFPEFLYFERTKNIEKLINSINIKVDSEIIFAIMLLDTSDNHKYFFHKYNLSKDIIKNLDLYSKLLKSSQNNKNFFSNDLSKNIFKYGKLEIRKFYIIYSLIYNKKFGPQIKDTLSKIDKIIIPKFPVSGNDLLVEGVKSGKKVGEILKKVEEIWVENDFKIRKDEIKALVKKHLN